MGSFVSSLAGREPQLDQEAQERQRQRQRREAERAAERHAQVERQRREDARAVERQAQLERQRQKAEGAAERQEIQARQRREEERQEILARRRREAERQARLQQERRQEQERRAQRDLKRQLESYKADQKQKKKLKTGGAAGQAQPPQGPALPWGQPGNAAPQQPRQPAPAAAGGPRVHTLHDLPPAQPQEPRQPAPAAGGAPRIHTLGGLRGDCCARCHQSSGRLVAALGKMWHPACLTCGACQQPVGDKFWQLPGWPEPDQVFCSSHPNDGAPRCVACSRPAFRGLRLESGRYACRDCAATAVLDTEAAQPVYTNVVR